MSSSYDLCEGNVNHITSWVVVMRGCARFCITVHLGQIQGTDFEKQLRTEIKRHTISVLQGSTPSYEPHHSICKLCLPLLLELARTKSVSGLSLEDFVNAPNYNLELVGNGSQARILGGETCSYAPVLDLCPMKLTDIPRVCRKELPLFYARSIRANIDNQDPLGTTQGRISTIDGRIMYFKPRESAREQQFDRELQILLLIKSRGLIERHTRVPCIQGVVISGSSTVDEAELDDQGQCIGVLLNFVPLGMSLLSPQYWDLHSLHEKWELQVTEILEELHANDVIWGDVNPGNVVIDESMDAWVIDFGGMNNPEFVDDGNAESIAGDWQGVRRLFREWLPRRRLNIPL
ncbi:hypothetical protein M409DRAFT_24637 [Zasmidium cellare ATCC 36951]|uniref:Protein kinase domain-containing protein n=1 Tax=Zasmidium cellare ATCC 36951 TaxID=1080233 RepID=A0A6A6CDI7_ZASCE|nr:uncharacterized protein M409DRAFT_24637 [Zasmidium cellare ATCC 36951]KAF2165254.1 hypothetical protein M409DRAFT_24637 [Zasmidium cellare ATCC 36951]